MMVYLIESGIFTKGSKDTVKIFADEKSALIYCFRRFGIKNIKRDNPFKTKGFRARWIGRKRWVLLTEHRVCGKVR